MSLLLKKAGFMGGVPLGILTLTNVNNADSTGSIGVRTLANGNFQWNNDVWNDNDFGTEWVDDGGATASQFESQLATLNTTASLTFIGWSGFSDWQPCDQTNSALDTSASGLQIIANLQVREIANTANIVTSLVELFTV